MSQDGSRLSYSEYLSGLFLPDTDPVCRSQTRSPRLVHMDAVLLSPVPVGPLQREQYSVNIVMGDIAGNNAKVLV